MYIYNDYIGSKLPIVNDDSGGALIDNIFFNVIAK